jgi:hypothetical protein
MGAIWKVVPCGHAIIESGKNKSVTASCSRTFGKEGHTLAIEWEISCFLTTCRQPVPIEISRGRSQIVTR